MKIKDVKIGMKVIGNALADKNYLHTRTGWVGRVVKKDETSFYAETVSGSTEDCRDYPLNPKYFDKYDEKKVGKDFVVLKVVLNQNEYRVIYRDRVFAVARCNKKDKFNSEFGLNLALRRFCKGLCDETGDEQKNKIDDLI